jgi:uncharacterized protein YndB with AHSA1/START domain
MASSTQVGSTTFTRPNDTQLVAMRLISAPPDFVWEAHTLCEQVKQWLLGPDGWTMPVCEIDLRPGGKYRYVYEATDGRTFQMSGEYQEIEAPERIVSTESMGDSPVQTVNTLTLTENGGRTVLRTVVDYPSKEVREEIISTGMLEGWNKSYDRLEKYLRGE